MSETCFNGCATCALDVGEGESLDAWAARVRAAYRAAPLVPRTPGRVHRQPRRRRQHPGSVECHQYRGWRRSA